MGIGTFAYAFIDSENSHSLPEINEVLRELADSGCDFKQPKERPYLEDVFIRQEYGVTLVELSDENNPGWFVHAPADVWLHCRAGGGFKVFFSSAEMLEYVMSGSKELCVCDELPFGKIKCIPRDQTPGQILFKTEEGTKHFLDIVERVVNEDVIGRDNCYLSLKEKDGTGAVLIKSEDIWTTCQLQKENRSAPRLTDIAIDSDKEAVCLLLQIHARDILSN